MAQDRISLARLDRVRIARQQTLAVRAMQECCAGAVKGLGRELDCSACVYPDDQSPEPASKREQVKFTQNSSD